MLAAEILQQYRSLDDVGRTAFLVQIAASFGADKETLDSAIEAYQRKPDSQLMARLHAVSQPLRRRLLERLNLAPGGIQALVDMRADLLRFGVRANALELLDANFVDLFTS